MPDLEHFYASINSWIRFVLHCVIIDDFDYFFSFNLAIKTGLFHAKLDQVNHKVLLE